MTKIESNSLDSLYSKPEILYQLDSYAEEYDFPILDNAHYPIAEARLTSFRNKKEWIIAFEIISVAITQGLFVELIYGFGNNLDTIGHQRTLSIFSFPKYFDENEIDVNNFELIINERIRKFSPSSAEYKRAQIDATSRMHPLLKILRFITYLYPQNFFLKNNNLLEILGKQNVKEFLKFDKWKHPDITRGEVPSQNKCFESLALALTVGDKSVYQCHSLDNTHWSNWIQDEY